MKLIDTPMDRSCDARFLNGLRPVVIILGKKLSSEKAYFVPTKFVTKKEKMLLLFICLKSVHRHLLLFVIC